MPDFGQIHLSTRASREVDRIAIEEYGIPGMVLMENAGRGVTDVLASRGVGGPVAICCGRGNNGGDGLVIARHLDLRGYDVAVHLFAAPEALTGDAAMNFEILSKTHVRIEIWPPEFSPEELSNQMADCAWIVDALLGTGAKGAPRPPMDAVVRVINASGKRILAVDVPSGLDADTGAAAEPAICAECTCTFGSSKRGYASADAAPYLGELYACDIGAPREIFDRVARAEASM